MLPTVRSVLFPTHAIMRPMTLRIANCRLRIGDCRVAAPPRRCRVGPLARSVSSRRASTLPVAALWRAPQIIPAAMFEPEGFDAAPRSRPPVGSFNPLSRLSSAPPRLRAIIFAPFAPLLCNLSESLLFAKTLPRIARIARMGKRRKDLESRTCLSVKFVKSVVPFFWLRLAAPSLRACVESSYPVTPSQTWSNHFPCLDHARQINGSACPSTTYTLSHEGRDRTRSNPVKPSQTQSNHYFQP